MHLVYFDESGNTGHNLNDPQQPVFLLGALMVPAKCWQKLEMDLLASFVKHFPDLAKNELEVHATDIRNGSGNFKGKSRELRFALRDEWLDIAKHHCLKFVARPVVKKKFERYIVGRLGTALKMNPYLATFHLLATVVNDFLLKEGSLGLFISDENKQVYSEVEKALRVLRTTDGPLKLSQVIEKGFFIDSSKSRVLQLCDMFCLYVRKHFEAQLIEGKTVKAADQVAITKSLALTVKGEERFSEVLDWLMPTGTAHKK